jgi:hypothetical protein
MRDFTPIQHRSYRPTPWYDPLSVPGVPSLGNNANSAVLQKKWMSGGSAGTALEGEYSNVTSSYAGKGVVR